MVDVGAKPETCRVAKAAGSIRMAADTFALIQAGHAAKGDVLGIARIAGIQGAKHTADLIPLCHPIALTRVAIEFELDEAGCRVHVLATCECVGRTGVEMEALTAAGAALLTIYDMCKAADRGMVIESIRLLEKRAENPAIGGPETADKPQRLTNRPEGQARRPPQATTPGARVNAAQATRPRQHRPGNTARHGTGVKKPAGAGLGS